MVDKPIKLTASARVKVTLTLGGHGPYGGEWKVEDIHRDSISAIYGQMRKIQEALPHIVLKWEIEGIEVISIAEQKHGS